MTLYIYIYNYIYIYIITLYIYIYVVNMDCTSVVPSRQIESSQVAQEI